MKLVHVITFLVLLSLVSLFGVAFMAQGMEHGDMMNPCPYSQGMNSMCPMTIAHHVDAWLSLFASTPVEKLALLSLAILFILISTYSSRDRIQNASSPGTPSLARFTRDSNPLQSLFSYFIRLFQAGILHPKMF